MAKDQVVRLNILIMNKGKTLERTVKRSTLAIGLIVVLAFSLMIGFTGVAMGLGSLFPSLNMVAKPFVCAGGEMSYEQQSSRVGSATYHTARWYCQQPYSKAEIDTNAIFFYSGLLYGILIFAMLLGVIYIYWNSSIGPAKNDGLRLY